MNFLNKNILLGVLVGVVLVLGVQWGVVKYEQKVNQEDRVAFLSGYSGAKDKIAYTNNYFSGKKSSDLSVSLSTSQASDEQESEYCRDVIQYITYIQDYLEKYKVTLTMEGVGGGDMGMHIQAEEYLQQARDDARRAGCFIDGNLLNIW